MTILVVTRNTGAGCAAAPGFDSCPVRELPIMEKASAKGGASKRAKKRFGSHTESLFLSRMRYVKAHRLLSNELLEPSNRWNIFPRLEEQSSLFGRECRLLG
jgi:hypothetical protein